MKDLQDEVCEELGGLRKQNGRSITEGIESAIPLLTKKNILFNVY